MQTGDKPAPKQSPVPAAPVEATGPGPLLVLYPDGLANLNGEASRLLLFQTKAEAVQLLAPTGPSCPCWLLLAPPMAPGPRHALIGRTDRVRSLRFRSRELGVGTFSLLPEGQETFAFQIEQEQPGRYRLVPVGQ